MWQLWPYPWRLALLLVCAQAETECPNSLPVADGTTAGRTLVRAPRPSPALGDIVGLDEAKAVLQEAVILPLQVADDLARLFWRSSESSAVLLAGPEGLGKRAAAEAAAAAAGSQVMQLRASEALQSDFCRVAMSAASSAGKPVLVIVEALETAPAVALSIRNCLREAVVAEGVPKIVCVATAGSDPQRFLHPTELSPFGYLVKLGTPSQVERKQFLLRLLAQVSRLDAQWGSALRESAVDTLANLTEDYTFTEMDFVVRRAFLRSTNAEGVRDPVALHHFEKILAETPPQSVKAFKMGAPVRSRATADGAAAAVESVETTSGGEETSKKDSGKTKKKKEGSKDPMESIFGWCNFWLPEPLHLPPVVWAMIVFGILAHLMARTTYQPNSHGRRRGGSERGGRSSLFGDMGAGTSPYSSFGDQLGDWPMGGANPFGSFPPPPGMPGLGSRGDASSMFAGMGGVGGSGGLSGDGAASGVGASGEGSTAASSAAPSKDQ